MSMKISFNQILVLIKELIQVRYIIYCEPFSAVLNAIELTGILKNFLHFLSVLYVRLVILHSRVKYVIQTIFPQILQRYYPKCLTEFVAIIQP